MAFRLERMRANRKIRSEVFFCLAANAQQCVAKSAKLSFVDNFAKLAVRTRSAIRMLRGLAALLQNSPVRDSKIRPKPKRIPDFPSEEDERKFWLTHDSAALIDWKSVGCRCFPNLRTTLRTHGN